VAQEAEELVWAVRRLTPRECERLQGFPDDYTDVPWRRRNWAPDGPRYKALGNSMAVNVMVSGGSNPLICGIPDA
jgi:site-specific DNA-cytosine methylase